MYKLKVDKEDTLLCLIRIINKHFIRNFTVEVSAFVVKQYYRNLIDCYIVLCIN
jgi:hypothetical protein